MVAWRAAVKRTPIRVKRHTRAMQPIGERLICQRDHLGALQVNVAMEVADEMSDARGFGEVAGRDDEHRFRRRGHNVPALAALEEHLAGMENGARREIELETLAVRSLDDPPDAPSIVSCHRDLDRLQSIAVLHKRVSPYVS